MTPLHFTLPHFPCQGRFSDPAHDFESQERELAVLAAKAPAALTSMDLYFIFNSFLPAGTFEEMAPYLPHALRLVQDDNGLFSNEAPTEAPPELLESLITWCHVEREELERHPQLRDSLEDAFAQLFRHWTSNTAWVYYSDGVARLRNADFISTFLEKGDWIASLDTANERRLFPWLRSAHYLPQLHALDTVPHAAWTLYLADQECTFPAPSYPISNAQRHRAVEMIEHWLLTTAAPEDIRIWDPVLIRHHEQLHLFPDAP